MGNYTLYKLNYRKRKQYFGKANTGYSLSYFSDSLLQEISAAVLGKPIRFKRKLIDHKAMRKDHFGKQ